MKHNFGAGPGILPHEVLKQAAEAVLNFNGTGLSILEISHRSPEFEAVLDEAVRLVKELLKFPKVIRYCFYRAVQAPNLLWLLIICCPKAAKLLTWKQAYGQIRQ